MTHKHRCNARLALLLAASLAAALVPRAHAAPGCTLELGAGPVDYDHCLPIDGIGSGFWLLWSVLPSSGSTTVVRWGMNSSASGYVAFAYPPLPEPDTGLMIGATALALQSCSSCLTGAQLREWLLGGTASGQMELTASLRLFNVTAEATAGGMAASFVQELPDGLDLTDLLLIFAAGGVFGNGGMRKHQTYGEGTLNLNDGTVADTETHTMSAQHAADQYRQAQGAAVCGAVAAAGGDAGHVQRPEPAALCGQVRIFCLPDLSSATTG
jgi:hypothetical protein